MNLRAGHVGVGDQLLGPEHDRPALDHYAHDLSLSGPTERRRDRAILGRNHDHDLLIGLRYVRRR